MNDITIRKGETFSRVIRWEALPFIHTPITAITRASPCVITAADHGLATGWRAAVLSAGGMRQINAKRLPPRSTEMHKVIATSASLVTLNELNSADFSAYTSGGFLVSYTPVSLSGFSARMQIRASKQSGTALVSLVSPTNIALDNSAHTITVTIAAADTAAYDFTVGVYDLEMVSGAGVVTRLDEGNVLVVGEVTR